MKKRIFILDDEPANIEMAKTFLEEEGYAVTTETEPVAALKRLSKGLPDLLLLDIRMPGIDGFEVCRRLKADPKTESLPIVILSVQSGEDEVVKGLERGAQDYIHKPFRKREFLARVAAALRLVSPPEGASPLNGRLRLDYKRFQGFLDGQPMSLTVKEFELLALLIKEEGRVLTRSAISDHVWQAAFSPTSRTIDTHINSLRRKMGELGHCIQSLRGVGYRFESES